MWNYVTISSRSTWNPVPPQKMSLNVWNRRTQKMWLQGLIQLSLRRIRPSWVSRDTQQGSILQQFSCTKTYPEYLPPDGLTCDVGLVQSYKRTDDHDHNGETPPSIHRSPHLHNQHQHAQSCVWKDQYQTYKPSHRIHIPSTEVCTGYFWRGDIRYGFVISINYNQLLNPFGWLTRMKLPNVGWQNCCLVYINDLPHQLHCPSSCLRTMQRL